MKVAFYTLGCKVNQYETDLMIKKFKDNGYTICDFENIADIYVVNSCSVTNLSTRKSRQYLSRAKSKGGIVVLAGCYSQEILGDKELKNVDIVIGNQEKNDIVEIVEKYINENNKKVTYKVSEIAKAKRYIQTGMLTQGIQVRESVKIEDGCNNFCTYCIIPYVRGRVRSRNIEKIEEEVKELVKSGVGEIVLVGIEIASYGKDLEENIDLINVIERINKIKDLKRIRLGSIEPRILTKENIIRMSKCEKLCPHFHLSVQSLDNNVLKRMNRKYTREDIFEIVDNIRKYFKNPAFTCDIIVGFPGESDEEFKNTIDGVRKVAFYEVHAFKYSKRKWTLAAKMEDQIDGNIAQKRSEILINTALELKNNYINKELEKKEKILIESKKDGYLYGYTPNYIMVRIKSDEDLIGKEIEVTLKEIQKDVVDAIK